MRRVIMGILATIGAIAALVVAYVLVSLPAMRARAREKSTEANMRMVQLAAEDYGVQDNGVYAANAARLVPLLPHAEQLMNAFTNGRSEPRQGPAPLDAPPGSVWYESTRDSSGALGWGYVITGFGKKGQLDLVLRSGLR